MPERLHDGHPREETQGRDMLRVRLHDEGEVQPARGRGPRAAVAALPRALPFRDEDRALLRTVAEEELRDLVRRVHRIEPEDPPEDRARGILGRDGLREVGVRHGRRRTASGLSLCGGGRRGDALDAPHEPEERDEGGDRGDHEERTRGAETGAEARNREQNAA